MAAWTVGSGMTPSKMTIVITGELAPRVDRRSQERLAPQDSRQRLLVCASESDDQIAS